MTEIKRYNINGDWYADSLIEEEHPQGEWVQWEDVKPLLEAMSKIPPKIDIDSGSVEAINKGDK